MNSDTHAVKSYVVAHGAVRIFFIVPPIVNHYIIEYVHFSIQIPLNKIADTPVGVSAILAEGEAFFISIFISKMSEKLYICNGFSCLFVVKKCVSKKYGLVHKV